jgi:hypothetical protein
MAARQTPALSSSSALQQQGSLLQGSAQWTSYRSEVELLPLTLAQVRQVQARILGWAQQGMPSSCAP